MATFNNASRKFISWDTYIPENDIREILGIIQTDNGHMALVVAGPKGGWFNLVLPDWFAAQSGADIEIGDGVCNGGWVGGKFVVPEFYTAD
jgi:hypothetical protein